MRIQRAHLLPVLPHDLPQRLSALCPLRAGHSWGCEPQLWLQHTWEPEIGGGGEVCEGRHLKEKKKEGPVCRCCQFSWCKYSPYDRSQAINALSLHAELGDRV